MYAEFEISLTVESIEEIIRINDEKKVSIKFILY
jgi:hypothetical protein